MVMGGFWLKGRAVTPNLCKRITLGAGDMSYSVNQPDVGVGDNIPSPSPPVVSQRCYLPFIAEYMTFSPNPMNSVPKTAENIDLKLIYF